MRKDIIQKIVAAVSSKNNVLLYKKIKMIKINKIIFYRLFFGLESK